MLAGMVLGGATGCNLILPDVSHQPVVHNPFPQLSQVAVAPFFNQSDEPTVDGRKFALAYFAELQAVPGFEVVPLGVVEEAIIDAPGRSVAARRSAAAGQDSGRRRRRRSARSPITRPTIRRAAACASNGTRRTLASTKFRPATACRGARRKKNSFPRRWCSKRSSRSPKRSWPRKRRPASTPLEPARCDAAASRTDADDAVASRPCRAPAEDAGKIAGRRLHAAGRAMHRQRPPADAESAAIAAASAASGC